MIVFCLHCFYVFAVASGGGHDTYLVAFFSRVLFGFRSLMFVLYFQLFFHFHFVLGVFYTLFIHFVIASHMEKLLGLAVKASVETEPRGPPRSAPARRPHDPRPHGDCQG
jgi:hypothetical protein